MLSALVIVFREVLEMSLVVGMLLAATEGVAGARRRIALGAFVGLLGAMLVAWLMDVLESSANGNGEFIYNAVLLGMASMMIAWTVIWMTRHGREVAARMRHVGKSVTDGSLPGTALTVATFAAVIREGGEAVFFLAGAATEGDSSALSMTAGGTMGLALGALLGFVIYRGMLRIPTRYVLQVTGWLLIFVAAGMASQAAWNLVIIDAIPPLVDTIWNTSTWLPQSGFVGTLLHVMIGYDDHPSGMQVLVFVVSLATMIGLLKYSQRSMASSAPHIST